MRILNGHFDFYGKTSRSQYWVACIIAVSAWVLAYLARDIFDGAIAIAIVVCVALFLTLATVRRLHDAGVSRWWTLLILFPFSITFDLGWLRLGGATFEFVDLADLIRNAPAVFGLMAPSRIMAGEGRTPLRPASEAA